MERIDNIGFGNLRLIQEPKEFCYGVDAVLLADFAAKGYKRSLNENTSNTANFSNTANTIVDLGTGTGVIPLILSHKTKSEHIVGIEIQENSYNLAVKNSQINNLQRRVSFINGDVKDVGIVWGKELKETVDMVVSNPPYFKAGGGIISATSAKSIARHEISADLGDFMACGAYLLKPMGEFFMVHRPSRLVDICASSRAVGLEPKEICFVSPKKDEPPNILLIRMVKGGGRELKFLPNMAVYNDEGNYTSELLEAYKD
jgi:tRNA1Val (adenine37-N6)-methyltransferase